MLVTIKDVRSMQYCSRGVRVKCEQMGISWADFVKNGIDSEILLSWDDTMVNKVVEQAEERHAREE